MQRAIAEVVWRLEISSPFQQQPGNAGMLVHYRSVERRLTICAARMQIRPGIQQQFDDGGIVACPGGQVQRQISVALACFEIRAGREQRLEHIHAGRRPRSHVQWGSHDSWVRACRFAPAANKWVTMIGVSFHAAQCNGVKPSTSRA